MAKSVIRIEARKLRQHGIGIKTIAKDLGVSSSTVSLWCRDIALTKEQIAALEHRSHDPRYGRRLHNSQKQHEIRILKTQRLFQEGKNEIGALTSREIFLVGVALYWAEGFKKDNLVGFSNSDPKMILLFIEWLRVCGIDRDRLKFRLGVNEMFIDSAEEIERYWQSILRVEASQFQKPYFQKVKWKKVYDNSDDYHGVLRVRVSKSTDFLRKIHGWIEGLGGHSSYPYE